MRDRLLTLLEVLFLALLIGGIALWSIPAAMVVAGVIGVAACEYQQRQARSSAAFLLTKEGRDR